LSFAPKFVTPPPVVVPMPELPELPTLPERPTVTAAAVAAADVAPAVTTPASDGGGAPRPAAPVQVEHIAYARFEPPRYPALSRRLGEEGVVVLRVLIDEQGAPVAVEVHRSSGYPRLDEAAREAVRRARFHPYREGEQSRPAIALVPVRFELT
jgi:protein TonB